MSYWFLVAGASLLVLSVLEKEAVKSLVKFWFGTFILILGILILVLGG